MFGKGQGLWIATSCGIFNLLAPNIIGLIISRTCSDILYGAVFFPISYTVPRPQWDRKAKEQKHLSFNRLQVLLLLSFILHGPELSHVQLQERLGNVVARQIALCPGKTLRARGDIPLQQGNNFCQSHTMGFTLHYWILDEYLAVST